MTTLLIAKTLKDNISLWRAECIDNRVTFYYGTLTPNNTPVMQPVPESFESDAAAIKHYHKKVREKLNKGYIEVPNEIGVSYNTLFPRLPYAKFDINGLAKPMKGVSFRPNTMRYDVYGQPKINGCRCIARRSGTQTDLFDSNDAFILTSNEGIIYNVPHITDALNKLAESYPELLDLVFDGELYCYGEKAPTITGAAKNVSNPINAKLVLLIFDLAMPNMVQFDRTERLVQLEMDGIFPVLSAVQHFSTDYSKEGIPIWLLETVKVTSDAQALTLKDHYINLEFEGLILRDMKAEYGFGQRVSTMRKWKNEYYGKFTILDLYPRNEQDKLPLFLLRNDINDETFESNPTGSHNELRHLLKPDHKIKLVGKQVLIKYRERTVNGIPAHQNVLIDSIKELLNQAE